MTRQVGDSRHVVFFSDCPYYGGAEEYIAMLARARPSDWRVSAIVSAGEAGEDLATRLAEAGATVKRCEMRPFKSPALWRDVYRLLRELRGEVLHINLPSGYDGRLSTPAPLAKLAGYRRVVATEHLPMYARSRKLLGVKWLCARAIDATIVHTEWNRQFLGHHHHLPLRRIVIIPNGSPELPGISMAVREERRRALGVTAGERALTIVARLTARKGHRHLFGALARIAAQGRRDWKLLVVGEGEDDARLRALAGESGIARQVVFLGQRADAPAIIQVSDLLIVPSMIESQPLVITEAMAGSVAVLASRIYGIPEIVADGETGLLVPPAQVDPLAEALARLLGEPGLLERLGEAGYGRYKAGFTQEIMARRTYAVLEGGAAARRESRAATRTLSTREIRAMKPVRFEDGQGNA